VLLRRAESSKYTAATNDSQEEALMIAVHSLRGGTGCSSLAVNLAVGLQSLWQTHTALLDLTMMAGQVALMLNASLKRTWSDITRFESNELDLEMLNSIITHHESGLSFIAAPTLPSEAETINGEMLGTALRLLKKYNDYLVVDLPHDFADMTLQALDMSDLILVVASPDMASIRATAAALDTYNNLGYPKERIKLVLSATFPRLGLPREKIEAALGIPVSIVIPHTPDIFVEAINLGQPFIYHKPKELISELLEDFAFHISKPAHKKSRPADPGAAWKRVYKRYTERRK
jgi:pilus assembly protein CpaE